MLLPQALVDMENMFELLHIKPQTTDNSHGFTLSCNDGVVVFDNVSFGYPSRKKDASPETVPESPEYVLRSVSFHVPAGGTFGIVGPTGTLTSFPPANRFFLLLSDPSSSC